MNHIDTIRAALELAREIVPPMFATHAELDDGLAALAELERAAAEPVAWMWEDMLGISHAYVSPKRPTWPDAGASPEMEMAINVRPLYAAPPAPVAEIREVEVTDESLENIGRVIWISEQSWVTHAERGRTALAAVRAELGPALGLVELKEPTPEELKRIAAEYQSRQHFADTCIWRDMYDAVRAVMWPKEGL